MIDLLVWIMEFAVSFKMSIPVGINSFIGRYS